MIQSNLKAIFFFVLTTLSFSIMSIIANEFVTINALLFYFVTSIFSAIAVITYFILTRTKFPQTKSYKLYIFRGMLNAVAMVLWCMSVKHIAVTDAMAISYISPIFTIILATWILKEKITSQGIIAIIAGFIGMLLILRPGFAVVTPTHYLLLFVTLIWAVADIITRSHSKVDTALSQFFYMALFTPLVLLPLVIFSTESIIPSQWLCIVVFAMLNIVNGLSFFYAYGLANVVTLAPFNFTRLIFTTLIAYFCFNETLQFWSICGSLIIFIASLYLIKKET